MDLLSALSTRVTAKLLGQIQGQIEDGLLALLRPEFKSIESRIDAIIERLDSIEEKADRQLLGNLKSALTFLSLEDYEKARDKLVEAEAIEPFGAVAKFWLSVLLFREGKRDYAIEKYLQSLRLNPFITQLCLFKETRFVETNGGNPGGEDSAVTASRGSSAGWEIGPAFHDLVPRTFYERFWAGDISWSAIEAASASGGIPVIAWYAGWDSPYTELRALSAHSFETGELLWSVKLRDGYRFLFATPTFTIVTGGKPAPLFELLDLKSGKLIRKMSKDYFETCLCPCFERLTTIAAFQSTNCVMPGPPGEEELKFRAGRDPGLDRVDLKGLADPFGLDLFFLHIRNEWKISKGSKTFSSLSAEGGFSSDVESWDIECTASVERTV